MTSSRRWPQTPNVMPQLHMPLQSGSDAVLRAMRRAYRRDKYLAILDRVRAAMPDAAITTDIIVGFPGETEQDFADTLDLVRQARFAGAFTFQYSIRPGTPAAEMPDQVPRGVVAERYERLAALVAEVSWQENQKLVGTAGRGARRRRRGPQGQRDAPDVGPGPGQPAGALRPARPGAAAWRRRHDRRDQRIAALPAGRQRRRGVCGAPAAATTGRCGSAAAGAGGERPEPCTAARAARPARSLGATGNAVASARPAPAAP